MCSDNLEEPEAEWTARGPSRFYFREAYDSKSQTFGEPSMKGLSAGLKGKVCSGNCIACVILTSFPIC